MALGATLYKAQLQIADLDRHYYADHPLTLAQHPSETPERLMVRLLAFALHASPDLALCRGLSSQDEPALWQKDLTGAIELWIEVGQPDERRLRSACHKAGQVFVYNYGGRGSRPWWLKLQPVVAEFANLHVVHLPTSAIQALAALAQRQMQLQCTIQEGQVWITDGKDTAQIDITLSEPE